MTVEHHPERKVLRADTHRLHRVHAGCMRERRVAGWHRAHRPRQTHGSSCFRVSKCMHVTRPTCVACAGQSAEAHECRSNFSGGKGARRSVCELHVACGRSKFMREGSGPFRFTRWRSVATQKASS
eukprot:511025-Prymnesium_polylepis.1